MKTMIVDNSPSNGKVYNRCGVDRVFIDLEIHGKIERQGHLDTVISNHTISDVSEMRKVLDKTSLLVRVNPINKNSEFEVNKVIESGADLLMLPMFKTVNEVEKFVDLVSGRAKVVLLLETAEAVARIDQILNIKGIDEVHIGLNDLHIAFNLDFMFELMASPILEMISSRLAAKGIPFGIGGIARLGSGDLPAEIILKEHIRLGSTSVILSRAFKGKGDLIEEDFASSHQDLRNSYMKFLSISKCELEKNRQLLIKKVANIMKCMSI